MFGELWGATLCAPATRMLKPATTVQQAGRHPFTIPTGSPVTGTFTPWPEQAPSKIELRTPRALARTTTRAEHYTAPDTTADVLLHYGRSHCFDRSAIRTSEMVPGSHFRYWKGLISSDSHLLMVGG